MGSRSNCRYYEGKLPVLDQVVMVNIKQVAIEPARTVVKDC